MFSFGPINRDKSYNKMKKIALISGITGQDGSFLAEFLFVWSTFIGAT